MLPVLFFLFASLLLSCLQCLGMRTSDLMLARITDRQLFRTSCAVRSLILVCVHQNKVLITKFGNAEKSNIPVFYSGYSNLVRFQKRNKT
jgi:hypothetical protein